MAKKKPLNSLKTTVKEQICGEVLGHPIIQIEFFNRDSNNVAHYQITCHSCSYVEIVDHDTLLKRKAEFTDRQPIYVRSKRREEETDT